MPTGCWDPGGPSDPWVCPWRLQAEFRPGCPLLSVRDECQGQCRRWARTRSVPEGAPRKRGPHYPPQFHCPSCLLSQARTGSGGSGPLRPGAASRVLTPGPCRHSSPVPHPGTRAPLCPIFPPLLPFTGRTVARLPAEVLPSPAPVPFPPAVPPAWNAGAKPPLPHARLSKAEQARKPLLLRGVPHRLLRLVSPRPGLPGRLPRPSSKRSTNICPGRERGLVLGPRSQTTLGANLSPLFGNSVGADFSQRFPLQRH